MAFIKLFIFPFLVSIVSSSIFGPNEFKLTLDLIKQLEIRQCILVDDNRTIPHVKKLSAEFLMITTFDSSQLFDYIMNLNPEDVKPRTAIVIREVDVLQHLPENETYKISLFTWFVFTETFFNYYNLPIPYDSEFIIIKPNVKGYGLTEFYTLKNNTFLQDFGTYDDDSDLKITNLTLNLRRLNFNSTTFLVMFTENADIEACDENASIEYYVCLVNEMIQDFAKILNFRSIRMRTSTINVGDIFKEGDLFCLLGPFHWTHYVYTKVGPIFKSNVNWYIKYPSTELRPDFFSQPFQRDFWLAIIFCIVIGGFLTLVIHIFMKKYTDENIQVDIIDNIFFGLDSFCGESNREDFQNITWRIFSIGMRITAFIVISSFEAVIMSFLTIEIPKIPFGNVDEFVKNGDYKLLLIEGNLVVTFVKNANPTLNNSYHDYVIEFKTQEYLDYLQKICYNKVAGYELDDRIWDPRTHPIDCNIYQISEPLTFVWMVMYLPINSPIASEFNYILLRAYESGVQKRMQKLFSNPTLQVVNEIWEEPFNSIYLEQMAYVLFIPVIGVLLAIIIAIGEFCIYTYRKKLQRKAQGAWFEKT